jgi:hypothetical protein
MDYNVALYCSLTVAMGLIAVGVLYLFARWLTRTRWPEGRWERLAEEILMSIHRRQPDTESLTRTIAEALADDRQRRNELWTTFGQVVVTALAIVVLAVLLLTKTVTAEAGLPILSGLSGFAIAKTVSGGRAGGTSDTRKREQ